MNDSSQQANRNPGLVLPDHDLGYWYDPAVEAGLHGKIRLSDSVEQHCTCGGKSPFMVYDAQRGEPVWCPCRSYRVKIYKIDQYIRKSGIPAPFRFKFLSDFKTVYEDGQPIPEAGQLKHYVLALIDSLKNNQAAGAQDTQKLLKAFYLWGTPGNGKTFYSYIVLNELMFRFARPAKFISLSKSFQEIRHTFDEGSATQGQAQPMLELLSTVPFLVIDDFGVQRNTEWELEILYNLIDARYANQRLTFVTTNQNITELKELAHGRIYSRLLEMCYVIHCTAPDYREMGNPEDKWFDSQKNRRNRERP